MNQRDQSRKAKYVLIPIVNKYREGNMKKNLEKRNEIEPETVC